MLDDDSIVELDSGAGAPLRAWVVVDVGVEAGTVPLDARGQAILACRTGMALQMRALAYGTPSDADDGTTLAHPAA